MNRNRSILLTLAFALTVAALAQTPEPDALQLTARNHAFDLSASEIPSGWTTLRLDNVSDAAHFAVFERMPEGRTMEDSLREVVPVFQQAMDLILDGNPEDGFAALGELPAWYGEVVFQGGTGIVAPGRTAEVTTFLPPGRYVVECYIKAPDGTFHTSLGMIDEIVVTDDPNGAGPPRADVAVTLTEGDGEDPPSGITIDGVLRAGPNTIAVHVTAADPPVLGDDLHVVRLDEGTAAEEVAAWMEWSRPDGLMEPAPATFLGGTQEMPRGRTAYVRVELEPGRYAFVSERPADQPMYRTFTVAPERAAVQRTQRTLTAQRWTPTPPEAAGCTP